MHASPAGHHWFRWRAPGKRVAVDLDLAVVEEIEAKAAEGLQVEGRGIEIGGLLLGRTRRDGGLTVVEIDEAESVPCEHAAGPSLMLSAGDRQALDERLKRRKGSVVGFYRSNTRREFAVTVEDVALMSWYFSRPTDVFLLVHASREQPLRAAFVTWSGRSFATKSAVDEFPFSSAALREWSRPMAPPDVDAVPEPAPAPIPPPAAPARSRARIDGRLIVGGVIAAGVLAGAIAGGLRRQPPAAEPRVADERTASSASIASSVAAARPQAPVAPPTLPAQADPTPAPEPDETATPAPAEARPRERVEPTPSAVTAAALPQRQPGGSKPEAVRRTPTQSADRQLTPFIPPRAPRRETPAMPDLPDAAPPVAARLPLTPVLTAPPASNAGTARVATLTPPPARETAEAPVNVAIDGISRVQGGKVTPPTVMRQESPRLPPQLRARISRDVLINVRVYVDRAGKVEFAELLSDGTGENRELASLAVFAARRWQFVPANRDGNPVPAQAVLRFRFTPEGAVR